MIQNYFKTLLRNMRKHKLHTAINLVGMAVAFTCTILLLLLVYFQYSFDSFHQNKERLYQVYNYSIGPQGEERSGSLPYPAAPTFKGENIGIEKAARYKHGGRGIRTGGKELDVVIQLTDPDFFSMFSFPVVAGNKASPLQDAAALVLTEQAAKNIFGEEPAVGKTVSANIGGEWKTLQVSAVVQDFPEASSIKFDALARIEAAPDYAAGKARWDAWHHAVYVQLVPAVSKETVEKSLRFITAKYNPADTAFMKAKGYSRDEAGDWHSLRLLPLRDVHFDAALSGGGMSKASLYVLMLISGVIMLIACFNFINLNIGLAFTRTKEMGVRKCLGAGKRQVWLQVWGESFFTVFVAMLIGAAATLFITRYLSKTTRAGITASPLFQPAFLVILVALLFLVSFLSSGYPAAVMSRLKAVEILKGTISLKRPGFFRNALITVQFVIACVLICATLVIYRQFQHMRHAPLGYTTTSLISIPVHNTADGKNIAARLRMRLVNQSAIVSVSGSAINLGIGKDGSSSQMGIGFDFNGRPVRTDFMPVDYDILKTLGIPLKEGRDFTAAYASDTSEAVIVTESMARQLTDGNALGLQVLHDSTSPRWHVVGVIPDFHLYSMHQKAGALTLALTQSPDLSYILIRVATQNAGATMDLVKSAYAQVEPGVDFKGSYVDENIGRWYEKERMLSRMFSIAAGIAILLSCMGLFGIAFIVIRQRVKEIGVRKVLGASVGSVAVLVLREFIRPVVVAIVLALPIAWWATSKWLEDFEYRTPVSWIIFLAGAGIAIAIAVATVGFQALRAAGANPVKSLRTE